jgi:hypothetical protein
VQACHAVAEATRAFWPTDQAHPNFVVCGVDDEASLLTFQSVLTRAGIRYRLFVEPDLDGRATALATEPIAGSARRHFRRCRLLQPGENPLIASLDDRR